MFSRNIGDRVYNINVYHRDKAWNESCTEKGNSVLYRVF
jgi:hypothetical protein